MSCRYELARYACVAALVRGGDEASGPAVLLTVAALGGPTRRGALLMAALTAAAAIGGPVVGALLDRARRPRAGYLAGLIAMATGLAVLAVGIDRAPLPVLLAAGLLAGLAQPMFSGGWTAQLGRLVGPDRFARASALDSATYDVGGIAGPALAGAALFIDPRAPLVVCVVLMLAAVPILAGADVRPGPPATGTPLRADITAGVRAVLGRPALRRVTLLSTLQHAGMAGRTIAAPLLAIRLTGGPAFAGILLSISAVASLASSIALTRRTLPLRPLTAAMLATAVTALSTAALAPPIPLWTVMLLFAVGGFVDAPLLMSVFAVRNAETPQRLRAQVFSTGASLKTSAYAGATVLFGFAAASGSAACLLGGAAVQVLGLLTAARRPSAALGTGQPIAVRSTS